MKQTLIKYHNIMSEKFQLQKMGYTVTFEKYYVTAQKGSNIYVDKDIKALYRLIKDYTGKQAINKLID